MAGQAQCPICDVTIVPASDAQASEVISCPDCGSDLEIKSLDPLVIAEAPRVEEDWGE